MAEPALVAPDTAFPSDSFSHYRLHDLYKEVRLVMAQRHAIEYRLLSLLRELDQREHHDGRSAHVASWLARTFGLGYGSAREKVRTARALGHLPLIDAAFREGKVSYSKVRALTRVVTSDNEAELLDAAVRCSTEGVEQIVRRVKQRERLDDVQQMLEQRSLTCAWDEDGALVVRARLTPEQGAIWLRALEKAEADLDPGDTDELAARQADAMTHAIEESLNDKSRSSSTGDRYQVVVHVSAETLAQDHFPPRDVSAETFADVADDLPIRTSSRAPTIERGPHLHPETVRRLTCDGALVSLLENNQGEVLNVGRKSRVIPSATQRALKSRDETCQYPGCSHTRYVDGHHIVHWANGGETKLSNLVLLCRRHHRLVHEFGCRVAKTSTGFKFVQRRTDQ